MKKLIALALILALFLTGCESSGSIEKRTYTAYDSGYDDGYRAGYEDGKDMQYEIDCEEMLRDGKSVNDIVGDVYVAYGLTPSEAAGILESYLCEPGHDGITKKEYELAREALWMTGSEMCD